MTPMTRTLARVLPRPLVPVALALIYALMLLWIAAFVTPTRHDFMYIDVEEVE